MSLLECARSSPRGRTLTLRDRPLNFRREAQRGRAVRQLRLSASPVWLKTHAEQCVRPLLAHTKKHDPVCVTRRTDTGKANNRKIKTKEVMRRQAACKLLVPLVKWVKVIHIVFHRDQRGLQRQKYNCFLTSKLLIRKMEKVP